MLVELDYWCSRRLAAGAFADFLGQVRRRAFVVADLVDADHERMIELLTTHAGLRVGFVDAAVMAIVERLGERKLATLDRRHFAAMRPRHVDSLQLLPELSAR